MQKTGFTNYSSSLVWSGLEKSFTFGCDHQGALCVMGHFWHGEPNRTTNQPGDPSASLVQGCIFRLTCSHPELTEDQVLTSACVIYVFRTVTKNAVNKSV